MGDTPAVTGVVLALERGVATGQARAPSRVLAHLAGLVFLSNPLRSLFSLVNPDPHAQSCTKRAGVFPPVSPSRDMSHPGAQNSMGRSNGHGPPVLRMICSAWPMTSPWAWSRS